MIKTITKEKSKGIAEGIKVGIGKLNEGNQIGKEKQLKSQMKTMASQRTAAALPEPPALVSKVINRPSTFFVFPLNSISFRFPSPTCACDATLLQYVKTKFELPCTAPQGAKQVRHIDQIFKF